MASSDRNMSENFNYYHQRLLYMHTYYHILYKKYMKLLLDDGIFRPKHVREFQLLPHNT